MSKYDFGNKLYALRTEKDLTQKELAKILGVSDKAVSKWETGEAMPRLKTLQLIAECFSASYEDLLSENAESCQTPPMAVNEPNDNPYERFYNKRLNGTKKRIKVELVMFALLILFNFGVLIVSNLAATFLGMMRSGLIQNILFNLVPIFLEIALWFFAKKALAEVDYIDQVQFAKKYYPTLAIPTIITSTLYAIQSFISGNTGIVIFLAGIAALMLSSLVATTIKKSDSIKYAFIIHVMISVFLYLNIFNILNSLSYGLEGLLSAITITEMLLFSIEINDILRKIQTLKKVDTPLNPQKVKFKKFAVRLFVVLISLLIIVSVILNLFPGILVKYTLAKSWENPNVTFFEHYDMKFEEGEATTFRIGDITIDMPVNYTMEDRSFDENEERNWWYIEEDKMAMSLECYPLISLLYGEDNSSLYTTSSALQEQENIEQFKKMLINTFGTYPRNEFEYKKLMYSLDADDINVFNYEQCVTYTVLLAGRDLYTMGNFYDITLYERNEIGAEIMKMKTSADREMYSVSIFVTGDKYEYHITFNGKFESVDVLYKILNSIEVV